MASSISAATASSISAAAATSTESTTAASSAATAATTTRASGAVNFDFLSVNDLSIQCFDSFVGSIIISHRYESVTLFCDVNIGDFTASCELSFQNVPRTPSVNSVYKKFSHFSAVFLSLDQDSPSKMFRN